MEHTSGVEFLLWKARSRPLVAVGVGVFVLFLAGVAAQVGGVLFFPLTLLLMTVLLWDFWTPARIRMDDRGVYIQRPGRSRFLPWSHIQRIEEDPEGILLAPGRTHSLRGSLRAVYLELRDPSLKQQVLDHVRRYAEHA